MPPLQDGLSALAKHAGEVLAVLALVVCGVFIMRTVFSRLLKNTQTETDLLSLGMTAWFLPVLLIALLSFGTSIFFSKTIGGFVALLIAVSSIFFLRQKIETGKVLIVLGLLSLSLILRMAFIKDMLLPAYFDSAEHYRIINLLLRSYQDGQLAGGLGTGYYHLGFHHLLAFVANFLRTNPLSLMLVMGQVMLAVLPVSFFFIIKQETNSTPAAIFTCLLAGFGFHMPAHLMNWGKYPALLGLTAMLCMFNLAYIVYRKATTSVSLFILFAISLMAAAFIHSRTVIIFGLLVIAVFITALWSRLLPTPKLAFSLLLVCLLVVEIIAIREHATINILFNTYATKDLWVFLLLLPLAFTAASHYPRQTFLLMLWLALCILCLFIPVTFPILGTQTLLDRPFAQMFIIVPFSWLGGLGFAALTYQTRRLFPNLDLIQSLLPLFLFGLVLFNAARHHAFYPDPCCQFTTRDDLTAFAWMDANLPVDANISISAMNLNVTSLEAPETLAATDAGIWISPLISRPVTHFRYDTSFNITNIHTDLCTRSIRYIYIGSTPQSFNLQTLNSAPDWYTPYLTLSTAQLYQVECP